MLINNKTVGTVYIKKDGNIAFQGLNNDICLVKRFSYEEVEFLSNHHNICSKNIYSNLVINGYGEYGDNTNFKDFIYNSNTNDFKVNVAQQIQILSQYMVPIDVNKKYNYSMDAYTEFGNSRDYVGFVSYDYDQERITADEVMYIPNTQTKLTKELKNGDKEVHLENISNWNITASTPIYQRGFIFWNYQDSSNHLYQPLEYSRNHTDYVEWYNENSLNKQTNTITLVKPWDGGTYPVGTSLSQKSSGNTNNYSLLNYSCLTSAYKNYHATITGTNYNNSSFTSFYVPTKYIGILAIFNYSNSSSTLTSPYTYIRNIIFEEVDE